MKAAYARAKRGSDPLERQRGFCGIALLVGLLAAIVVIAALEYGRFSPSSPPIRIISQIEAWNQAVAFAKTRIDKADRAVFPVYNPAFVRQPSPGTWKSPQPSTCLMRTAFPPGGNASGSCKDGKRNPAGPCWSSPLTPDR